MAFTSRSLLRNWFSRRAAGRPLQRGVPRRLGLEEFEDRLAPATWGNPWPDAAHLTLSFVPDRTPVANQASSLFQTLNAQFHTSNPAAWQQIILRAFQTWAVNANVNVSLQADSGDPVGATGAVQGDSRFGDIRIGAFAIAGGGGSMRGGHGSAQGGHVGERSDREAVREYS